MGTHINLWERLAGCMRPLFATLLYNLVHILCYSPWDVIVAHGETLLTLIYQNWVLYETLNQAAFSWLVNTFIKTKRLVTNCALPGWIHIDHENNILTTWDLIFYFISVCTFWDQFYETNRTIRPLKSNIIKHFIVESLNLWGNIELALPCKSGDHPACCHSWECYSC